MASSVEAVSKDVLEQKPLEVWQEGGGLVGFDVEIFASSSNKSLYIIIN